MQSNVPFLNTMCYQNFKWLTETILKNAPNKKYHVTIVTTLHNPNILHWMKVLSTLTSFFRVKLPTVVVSWSVPCTDFCMTSVDLRHWFHYINVGR